MMHMTFYWSKEVTLLVNSWRTSSWLAYLLTLLACAIAAAFYQYMEDLRLRIKIAAKTSSSSSPIQAPLLQKRIAGGRCSLARPAGSLLFGVNSALGYLLMLAIMSFNGGVFVAVVAGLALGFLLFRTADEDIALVVDNPCACA